MQTSSNLDAESADCSRDRSGAPDGSGWAIETNQKTIPSGLYFSSSEAPKLLPDRSVMSVEDTSPLLITQGSGALRRSCNIGEQHGGKHSVNVRRGPLSSEELNDVGDRFDQRPQPQVGSGLLNQRRDGNMFG
jgi:hypothetical protein